MKFVLLAAALVSLATASPLAAALAVGDPAPDFSIAGAQGGTSMTIALSELRQKGPVVIFFFPSAFTDGPECRDFARNFDKLRAAGASVVGISRDSIDTLARFSTEECPGKVPVASASESLVNGYDVNDGAMFNTRTTYVIDSSGRIVFVDDDPDYAGHAAKVLAFVEGMKK